MWEFQLILCSSIESHIVTESTLPKWFSWLVGSWVRDDSLCYSNLCVCFVCLFIYLFIYLLDCLFLRYFFAVVTLNDFVTQLFQIKIEKRNYHRFCRWASSSLNLMTFCHVFHGGYEPPCPFFYYIWLWNDSIFI